MDTERGCRGPVLRCVDTPRSRLLSRGYRDTDVLVKGEVCCIGTSSDGRRKAGGIYCALLALKSPLIAGRMNVDADMAVATVNGSSSA